MPGLYCTVQRGNWEMGLQEGRGDPHMDEEVGEWPQPPRLGRENLD